LHDCGLLDNGARNRGEGRLPMTHVNEIAQAERPDHLLSICRSGSAVKPGSKDHQPVGDEQRTSDCFPALDVRNSGLPLSDAMTAFHRMRQRRLRVPRHQGTARGRPRANFVVVCGALSSAASFY